MQLSFKSGDRPKHSAKSVSPSTLAHLRRGEQAVIDRLDLPEDVARRLMELGFLPGSTVTAGLSAPGGDPRVFQVDGSEIALRKETADRLRIRRRAHASRPPQA
jgi:ferrous iron transport protein A